MTDCFLFKTGNKAGCFEFTTPIQHNIRSPSLCNKARKTNKRLKDWKGRNKTVSTHGQWLSTKKQNSKESTQKNAITN